jgi:hypothetical protein
VACCDCTFAQVPFVEFKPTIFEIYTKMIFPHYKLTQLYINEHSGNISEISDFLKDLTYDMKSECKETIVHKLIINICRSSPEIRKNMRLVICAFLFQYLSKITNEEVQPIKSHLFNNDAINFWDDISK